MAEIKSAIIPLDRVTYTDAPLIWSELSAAEQAEYAGGQFDSLTLWEAAVQGTLTDQHTAVLFAFGSLGLSDSFVVAGSTTTTTNYFKIVPYEAHKPTWGRWDESKAWIKGSISLSSLYCVVSDLQIKAPAGYTNALYHTTTSTTSAARIFLNGNNELCYGAYPTIFNITFDRFIFFKCNGDWQGGVRIGNPDGTQTVKNSIAAYCTGTYSPGFRLGAETKSIGNIAIGNTYRDFYGATTHIDSTNNVSSMSGAYGASGNDYYAGWVNYDAFFTDPANGDFTPTQAYCTEFGKSWGAGAVPWERVVIVDTDSAGSLNSAEAAEQTIGDQLVTRNEKVTFQCQGATADTAAVTIDSNWQTDSYCFVTIEAAASDRHNGVWDDTKYRLVFGGANPVITQGTAFAKYLGLQFDGVDKGDHGIECIMAGTESWVDRCIVKNCSYGLYSIPSNIVRVTNVIFYDINRGHYCATVNADSFIHNCTSINHQYGFGRVGSIKNCIAIGGAPVVDNFLSAADASSLSDTGTDGSTLVSVYSESDTLPLYPDVDCVIFKDVATNDYRLVSHLSEDYKGVFRETNSAIGNGVYIDGITDDCAGQSRMPYMWKGVRTARAWDIGADQTPAERLYIVDTDGVSGDYSGIESARLGMVSDGTNLVADNCRVVIKCQATEGDTDVAGVGIISVTTSNECRLIITADSHDFVWDSTKYNRTGRLAFNTQDYTVENLQIAVNSTEGIFSNGPYYQFPIIRNNIIKHSGATTVNKIGISLSYVAAAGPITGNIVYGFDFAGSYGIRLDYTTATINNNTVYGCDNGIMCKATANGFNDNISIGNTLDFIGTHATATGNVSSDNSQPGTGYQTALTAAQIFTNVTASQEDFTPLTSAKSLHASVTKTVGAIPYVARKVVDPGGTQGVNCDYTSLNLWEAAEQALYAEGETAWADCITSDGSADVTQLVLADWNSGVIPKIVVRDGHKHQGKYDTSKYRLELGATPVKIQADNVQIHGLQIKPSIYNVSTIHGIEVTGFADTSLVNDCIVWQGYDNYRALSGATKNNKITNSIMYDAGYVGIYFEGGTHINAEVRNTTVYNANQISNSAADGINLWVASGVAVNCVVMATNYVGEGTVDIASSRQYHCVTSDTSANTSQGGIQSQTDYANYFVNTTAGSEDFHTKQSPYALWGANAAYAGAFGSEPFEVICKLRADDTPSDTYSTFGDWRVAAGRDLVVRNERAVLDCYNDWPSGYPNTATLLDLHSDQNWKTDDTHYILIRTPTSERHTGIPETGFFIASTGPTFVIINRGYKLVLEGLEIQAPNASSPAFYNTSTSAGANEAINCIFNNMGYGISGDTHKVVLRNCIGIEIQGRYSIYSGKAYNCTFQHSGSFSMIARDSHTRNVIGIHTGTPSLDLFYGSALKTGDYNISSDASAPGSNSITNVVVKNSTDANLDAATKGAANWVIFKDTTTDDYRLHSVVDGVELNDAIDAGVDLSHKFTDDIAGNTRETPWDIGAFVYVADSGITLTVNNLSHAIALDNTDLVQKNILSVNNLSHAHNIDNVSFDLAVLLIVQSLLHSQGIDNVSLTQAHTLAMQDLQHTTSLEVTDLVQASQLAIQDLLHQQEIENADLVQKSTLAIQNLLHSLEVENASLTQKNILAVQSLLHSFENEALALTQKNTLSINDLVHAHTLPNIDLGSAIVLAVQSLQHGLDVTSPNLVQKSTLVLQNLLHSLQIEGADLTQKSTLTLQSLQHTNAVSEANLVQKSLLAVANLQHVNSLEDFGLAQKNVLSINNLVHGHGLANVELTLSTMLAIQDLLHSTSVTSAALTQKNILAADNLVHGQSVTAAELIQKSQLIVDNLMHLHDIDNLSLSAAILLAVQDLHHAGILTTTDLTQAHILAVDNLGHTVSCEQIDLTQQNLLNVEDLLHNNSIDQIVLAIPSQGYLLTFTAGSSNLSFTATTTNKFNFTTED